MASGVGADNGPSPDEVVWGSAKEIEELRAAMLNWAVRRGVQRDAAEDLVVEAWRTALEAQAKGRLNGAPVKAHQAWVVYTFQFAIKRHIRRVCAEKRALTELGQMKEAQIPDSLTDAIDSEREDALSDVLKALPADLAYIAANHGKPHSEIALALGIPIAEVRNKKQQLIRRIMRIAREMRIRPELFDRREQP